MIERTVGICESFKAIGIDISEADLGRFEKALHEHGLNVAPLAATKRPAAFIVYAPDRVLTFLDEHEAVKTAEELDVEYHGLYLKR